jgi:hypothetical protein
MVDPGAMGTRMQIVAVVATTMLFVTVFELVRRRRLMERYALLWMFSTVVLLGLAVWKDALERVAETVGIFYAPSALFAIAFGFVLVLLLHFSLVVSRLADQTKVLAQRLSLMQQRIDELEEERHERESTAAVPEAAERSRIAARR